MIISFETQHLQKLSNSSAGNTYIFLSKSFNTIFYHKITATRTHEYKSFCSQNPVLNDGF